MGEKRPNPDSNEAFKPCDTKDEPRKIFVGGLTRNTSTDVMKSYFGYYGTIIDAIVMVDDDGHSRGFGFVTFDNAECVDKVLLHPVHFLDGKQVDVKRSVPKAMRPPPRQLDTSKKAFLGGLPTDMNEADLREFFSIYGKVTDCVIMYDEKTMKSRGFGFIGFEDETIIDKLLKQQHLQIRHKQVEVKLARPRTHPSVFNAAAVMMGGSGPMIGPRMPAGMGAGGPSGSAGGGVGGYDYSAYSSYNYGGGYGYGSGAGYGNGTSANDPPAKRLRGEGAGGAAGDGSANRQPQPQQQYPYQYGQYNYDAYNSYYNQYGQNPYPNYQYPSQYYGTNEPGKDGSAAGGQQPQNSWPNYQQNYNYPSSPPSGGPAPSSTGQPGSGSDSSNMNMLMPMMMQGMMFMQQAQSMFQNMMKKDGDEPSSGAPPGNRSDQSNASQSMEHMRALMQQKAAEYARKK